MTTAAWIALGILRAGGPYMPWLLSVAFPVGAVVAQLRMRSGSRAAGWSIRR